MDWSAQCYIFNANLDNATIPNKIMENEYGYFVIIQLAWKISLQKIFSKKNVYCLKLLRLSFEQYKSPFNSSTLSKILIDFYWYALHLHHCLSALDFTNLDFHTSITPIRKNIKDIAMKIIIKHNLDDLGFKGPSSPLTDFAFNGKFSWFFDFLDARNLATTFNVGNQLLVYQLPWLSIFSFTYINGWDALHFLVVEASISITTTLEFGIRLINSDKWIDQPNVTQVYAQLDNAIIWYKIMETNLVILLLYGIGGISLQKYFNKRLLLAKPPQPYMKNKFLIIKVILVVFIDFH